MPPKKKLTLAAAFRKVLPSIMASTPPLVYCTAQPVLSLGLYACSQAQTQVSLKGDAQCDQGMMWARGGDSQGTLCVAVILRKGSSEQMAEHTESGSERQGLPAPRS